MGQFACIQFNQDNILTSKKEIAVVKEVYYANRRSYEIKVGMPKEALSKRQKIKLEAQLDAYEIEYVAAEEALEDLFENKVIVSKEQLMPYLAKPILDYINYYGLCHKNRLFWKVGIIVGRSEQMMGVLTSIVQEISELVLFADTPYMYKDLIGEIYEVSRLKAKGSVPHARILREMDIIFDCQGTRDYAKWCSPNVIYIDWNHYYKRKEGRFKDYPPMIWHDFEILCGRQIVPIEILQGLFKVEGISKRQTALMFKELNLKISRVYNACIS